MEQKPDGGGLRNTIYQQQTASGRRLTRGRLLIYRALLPLAMGVLRLLWGWCRVERVLGAEHIPAVLARDPAFIPVYWHQHQLFCVRHLLEARRDGVKLAFLISPSIDGEIGAMLVRRLGAVAIRGSSTHTGARALRDYYQALKQDGLSPAITPDGPRGPPWKFKPGAVLLSQLCQRPIVPMAYAASRAWTVKWDHFVIPKPLARIVVAIGEPVYVPRGLDSEALERHQIDMEHRLLDLFQKANSALSETPKSI